MWSKVPGVANKGAICEYYLRHIQIAEECIYENRSHFISLSHCSFYFTAPLQISSVWLQQGARMCIRYVLEVKDSSINLCTCGHISVLDYIANITGLTGSYVGVSSLFTIRLKAGYAAVIGYVYMHIKFCLGSIFRLQPFSEYNVYTHTGIEYSCIHGCCMPELPNTWQFLNT